MKTAFEKWLLFVTNKDVENLAYYLIAELSNHNKMAFDLVTDYNDGEYWEYSEELILQTAHKIIDNDL